ncbi:MAG: hypothetical protein FJW30_23670 [Acidobacteria bacterium]|nr:hypothetical protein [Acidobacteriota bacterium]
MRCCALLLSLCAFGQSETRTFTFDGSGRAALDSVSAGGTASIRSINGRMAPLEKVEEKVLREDASGKVTERIIRPFDPNGNPGPPQKIVVDERKSADGSLSVDTQVFHGNVNGGFSLAERSQAVTRTTGGSTVTDVAVQRPTLNGGLELLEKKSTTLTKAGAKETSDSLTYRRDTNGSFYTAARELKQTDESGGKKVENVATYIAGDRRELQLAGQSVAETSKRADGSETRQVRIYGMNAPGRPAGGQPVLREQQTIEKSRTAGGTVETLSVQRPAVDNPNSLGAPVKVSEKVCTGKCF